MSLANSDNYLSRSMHNQPYLQYDKDLAKVLFHGDEGIRPAPFVFGITSDNAVEETEDQADKEGQHLIPDAKSCSTCGVKFEDLAEQRQHFKMDWHRFESRQCHGMLQHCRHNC